MEYTSPVLTEQMISQWLKDHRAEYGSATETIRACLANFGLQILVHLLLSFQVYLDLFELKNHKQVVIPFL